MEYKDYYQILGVSKDADVDDIKKAYRKLARKHHPDVNPGDDKAEERFKEINEAYQVLSDAEKRAKYDQFGSQWQQYTRAGGQPEDFDWGRWSAGSRGGGGYTRTVSPEEFEQMFGGGLGGFSDFFETLFGGGGMPRSRDFGEGAFRPRPTARRGRDLEQPIHISLEEAFYGTTRTLQWEGGRVIEAQIPRGVRTGSRVRLSGQGNQGSGGAKSGDLYLVIEVSPHPTYEREGDDLLVTVPVDLYTALLGGEAEVVSIDRSVRLTIPPETPNGKVFRLRGLGMPTLRDPKQRGDLFATVEVRLPKDLSEEEKDLYEKLKALRD
jgi:curved DNA-binding protein